MKEAGTLARLTNLRSLGLADCELEEGDAAALTGLTALTHLNLSTNGMDDDDVLAMAVLKGLASLAVCRSTELEFDAGGIEIVEALAALTALTSLRLSHNLPLESDGSVGALTTLIRLQRLDLDGCYGVDAASLAAVARLPSLVHLKVVKKKQKIKPC